MTTRRTLDTTFADVSDLPLYLPDLPAGVPAALRRYTAISAPASVGGPVASIANLGSAPGALVSASGGQSPTLREATRRYLEFDGTDDMMQAAASDAAIGTGPVTYYAVARFRASPAAANFWNVVAGGTTDNTSILFNTAGNVTAYRGTSYSGAQHTPGTAWHVFLGVFNGSSSVLRMDAAETTGTVGTTVPNTMVVGKATGVPIDIAEVGAFGSALDATTRTTLVNYLATLYAL